jgi:hypothetical protein
MGKSNGKLEDQIIILLGSLSIAEVAKKVDLSESIVKIIAMRNRYRIIKVKKTPKKVNKLQKARLKRNVKVLALVEAGLTYVEINKQLKIQNSGRIGRQLGVQRNDTDTERWVNMIGDIKHDIKSGVSYDELKIKYNLKVNRSKLGYHGLSLIATMYRDIRNDIIVKEYKSKIARVVLKSSKSEMDNPERLTSVASVYNINGKHGFKKYPKIGNRNGGGLFVEPEVIKIIKRMKARKKPSTHQEISDELNKRGFISPMGNPYNMYMVGFKLAKIKKLKL